MGSFRIKNRENLFALFPELVESIRIAGLVVPLSGNNRVNANLSIVRKSKSGFKIAQCVEP